MPPKRRRGRPQGAPPRFLPVYRTRTGRESTRYEPGRKRVKGRWFDSQDSTYIGERQYVRRKEGVTKEQKAAERRQGIRRVGVTHERVYDPELRGHVWYERMVDSYQSARAKEGLRLTRGEVKRSFDFQNNVTALRDYEDYRRQLMRAGAQNPGHPDHDRWRALVSPQGPYAAVLVYIGLRSPNQNWNVGDSPPSRGISNVAA